LYPCKRRMVMDMEVIKKHADVQIRTSFIHREFDYQDIRKDFVYNILTFDLLEKPFIVILLPTAIVRLVIEIVQKNVTRVTRWLNHGSTGHHLHLGAQLVGNHD
ncbi:14222_t:CDS:2, partial [Cetraspora pellucida]